MINLGSTVALNAISKLSRLIAPIWADGRYRLPWDLRNLVLVHHHRRQLDLAPSLGRRAASTTVLIGQAWPDHQRYCYLLPSPSLRGGLPPTTGTSNAKEHGTYLPLQKQQRG